ncbi:dihydrofolate reductase family protein [Lysobacter sp. CA199]|uniref:dihydrofolate reductase family protein n=1 Tax=Lysobacter sp. CA199 TaxID=3455608 RepID=UPI003F8D0647
MGQLFLSINVSLDGYIEDRERGIDWFAGDDDPAFEDYINDQLRSIDGMIFGRKAHELLARYWPDAASRPGIGPRHREAAQLMNRLPKYVLSNSDYRSDWVNSHAIGGDVGGVLGDLKRQSDRGLALFAGAGAARSVMASGLIDEYRILVNPTLLGGGTRLFEADGTQRPLRLLDSIRFDCGIVALHYAPRHPAS